MELLTDEHTLSHNGSGDTPIGRTAVRFPVSSRPDVPLSKLLNPTRYEGCEPPRGEEAELHHEPPDWQSATGDAEWERRTPETLVTRRHSLPRHTRYPETLVTRRHSLPGDTRYPETLVTRRHSLPGDLIPRHTQTPESQQRAEAVTGSQSHASAHLNAAAAHLNASSERVSEGHSGAGLLYLEPLAGSGLRLSSAVE
ncbi:hypothetical protein EYF80_050378 [Liparis tanakae]|uniref:Uncharacterized protein n=1 Tax=Liparis tanakae TaxID=230148 RepID=A0A4Z2FEZ0_9TELE|nr:hypothetical protein EYF80_050378 [Liparis tanakae]